MPPPLPEKKDRNDPRKNLKVMPRTSPRTVSPLALDGKTSSPRTGKKLESPLASPIPSPTGSVSPTIFPDSSKKSAGSGGSIIKKKGKRDSCPCGGSSEGQDWVLQCSDCRQCWHASCANLKGTNDHEKECIDSILEFWLCPWCFCCPYPRPKSHPASKKDQTLAEQTAACTTLQQIKDAVGEAMSQLPSNLPSLDQLTNNNTLLGTIQDQLNKLSTDVQTFAQKGITAYRQPSPREPPPPIESTTPEEDATPNFEPFSAYKENFVTEEFGTELLEFLNKQHFEKEGSRNVLFYGEKYKYMGSDKSPQPIPQTLKKLIKEVTEEFNIKYDLNQVLVNKYTKASSLPFHSDNEAVINPNSSIFSLSLGAQGCIKFKEFKAKKEETLTVHNRSLYVMTRESQNHIGHQVAQHNSEEVRYSVTLRAVHWQNFNSTYAVGDSNFGRIKFGQGRGKIGASTPGFKDFAACVKDLNPRLGCSYRNIVIMSGTNDLKHDDVNVLDLYKLYKGKVEKFREFNPKGNIFICPVLPTKDKNINKRVNEFNRYLFDDLLQTNLKVNMVQGFREFAERDGSLRNSLHDPRTEHDVLHINDRGYCILVRLIKLALFSVKRDKGKYTTGRSFRNVLVGGPPNPV
jgi:alkylated DNA repair dioxygenase AlkB